MYTIKALVESIRSNIEAIRNDICSNTCGSLLPYLNASREYLLAPDLCKNTWANLSEEGREAFYLFILMNEIFHHKPASRNFLVNVLMYLPQETNIYLRIKLFAKLVKMNHIQNQYKELVIDFLTGAGIAYQVTDLYLDKESVKQMLLCYFATFIHKSRECFSGLGQETMVQSILPNFVSSFTGNQFGMDAMGDLLGIITGTYNRGNVKIQFYAPAV